MKVIAEFDGIKIRPVKFWRDYREYNVKNIAIVFERQDGGRKYICFGVDTGGATAELVLDTLNFQFSIRNFQSIF